MIDLKDLISLTAISLFIFAVLTWGDIIERILL